MFKHPINRREVMQTTAQAGLALAVGGAMGIESAWAKDRGPALPCPRSAACCGCLI